MELPDIGQHCSIPLCQQLDFLPYTCTRCKKVYCANHRRAETHNCSVVVDRVIPSCPVCGQVIPVKPNEDPNVVVARHIDDGCPQVQGTKDKFVCEMHGCNVSGLAEKFNCPGCGHAFCLSHRQPSDHKCPKPAPHSTAPSVAQRNPDLTAIIKKN